MGMLDSLTESKQKVLIRAGAAVAGLACLAILLPVIYSAFLAGLGILGLGVTAILGVAIFQALPLLGQKWENAILSARKSEARANPIEQAQNRLIKRKEQIHNGELALGRQSGTIKTMERMLDEQAKKDPDHDLTMPRKSLEAMKQAYTVRIEKLKQAIQDAKQYEKEIERKKFELVFAQTSQAADTGLQEDPMQQLLADEGFKSISDRFDESFGALEVSTLLAQTEQMQSTQAQFEEIIQTRERSIG